MSLTVTPEIAAFLKKRSPALGAIIDSVGLLDIRTSGKIFPDLVSCMIGQMISTKAAQTIEGRFVQLVQHVTPENIKDVDVLAIKSCGMSLRKATYIKALAKKVYDKELSFDHFPTLSDADLFKALKVIDGIGQWTAEMIAMFTLARENIFSYDDLALRNGIAKVHHLKKMDKTIFTKYQKKYHPYASYAALYYYHAYDGKAK